MKKIIGTFLTGCAGGVLAFAGLDHFNAQQPQTILVEKQVEPQNSFKLTSTGTQSEISAQAIDFSYAADATLNSVVHIKTEIPASTGAVDPLYHYFFGPAPRSNGFAEAMGSGVVLTADGYIVTNNHVVDNARKISVTLNNNKSYPAKLIGADPGTDIAVLKIDAKELPAIRVGNSDEVKIGEWVLAVGNPFNLNSTVTAGIVSAKSRNINILQADPDHNVFPIESFIQTDAAVNPGNSGGALVNARGELIGINTAIASNTGSFSGYSFAVPVNLVQKVTGDLIRFGVVQRAFLGVNIRNIDQDLANELGLKELNGVYVGGTVEGGAGEAAGLQIGDIITAVGESSVKNVPELQEHIGRFRPGDVVQIRIKRNKDELLVPVTLRNSEGTTGLVKKEVVNLKTALGATFTEPSAVEKQRLRLKGGAKVLELKNGKLRSAGLKQGFIITKVDDTPVTSPEHLMKVLSEKKGGVLVEGVYPNGARGYFAFGL